MNTFKVVLTGGPCAGKSKILKRLIEYYSTDENKIFVVPETASEVLASGIKFVEVDDSLNFQDIIIDRQLNKERTLYRGMMHIPLKENNLVFLDRGLIDNKAYLKTQYQFDILLERYDLEEIAILDSYDLVIDLISLATPDPELFMRECTSNEYRYEDLKGAQEVDKKTTQAWLGHRNVKYIYPTETIEEKTDIVIGYINDLINHRQKKNTEMYLIEEPMDLFVKLNDENSKKIEVIDCYLNKEQKCISNTKTILRKRFYKDYESKLMIQINEDGSTIEETVINQELWDYYVNLYGIEKEVKKIEYTTNELGSVCKITCYDDFTTLELPRTNYKKEMNILNNFSIIENIENFEEFYDKRNKQVQKKKKYGNI